MVRHSNGPILVNVYTHLKDNYDCTVSFTTRRVINMSRSRSPWLKESLKEIVKYYTTSLYCTV